MEVAPLGNGGCNPVQSKLARLCGEAATLRIQVPTRSRPAHRSVVGAPTPPTARGSAYPNPNPDHSPSPLHHSPLHHSPLNLHPDPHPDQARARRTYATPPPAYTPPPRVCGSCASLRLCRKQAGSDIGRLALQRPPLAPEYASGPGAPSFGHPRLTIHIGLAFDLGLRASRG